MKYHRYIPFINLALNNVYTMNSIVYNQKFLNFSYLWKNISKQLEEFLEKNKACFGLKLDNITLIKILIKLRHSVCHLERKNSIKIIENINLTCKKIFNTKDNSIWKIVAIFLFKDQYINFINNLNDEKEITIDDRNVNLSSISDGLFRGFVDSFYNYNIIATNAYSNEEQLSKKHLKIEEKIITDYNLDFKSMEILSLKKINYIWIEYLKNTLEYPKDLSLEFDFTNKFLKFKISEFRFCVDIFDIKNLKKLKLHFLTKYNLQEINNKTISFSEYNELGTNFNNKVQTRLIKELTKYIFKYKFAHRDTLQHKKILIELNGEVIDFKRVRNKIFHFDYPSDQVASYLSQVLYYLVNYKVEDRKEKNEKVAENISKTEGCIKKIMKTWIAD